MILETRSIVDALRWEIQAQILRGAIPAGSTLPEVSVAKMFDVARPTAKAAIEQLVHMGLLRRLRNKTARVPLVDAADVADIYLSRVVVEIAIARRLAERGHVPSEAMQALDRFCAVMGNNDKLPELVRYDVDFHRALAEATGSPRLRRLHEQVISEAHLCMAQVQLNHLLRPQVIADEHQRIVAMIEYKDVEGVSAEMDAHISRARRSLVTHLERQQSEARR